MAASSQQSPVKFCNTSFAESGNGNKLWPAMCTVCMYTVYQFLWGTLSFLDIKCKQNVSNLASDPPFDSKCSCSVLREDILTSFHPPNIPWRISPGSASSKRTGDSVYLKMRAQWPSAWMRLELRKQQNKTQKRKSSKDKNQEPKKKIQYTISILVLSLFNASEAVDSLIGSMFRSLKPRV